MCWLAYVHDHKVALLHDEEEKTRANAAGALGNLVRNSPLLVSVRIGPNASDSHKILPANDKWPAEWRCWEHTIVFAVRGAV